MYQWSLQVWKPQKQREKTCKQGLTGVGGGGGDSDNTSGVNTMKEEEQKVRREPEAQPGQGSGPIAGEESRTSDALKVKGKHTVALLHLESKHRN